ncbi:MAG: bis(5'-nucleosyl)-tetraphosphatase (symmetrical) [Myxococcota bacterium]|jgi:bis(5'-nucleosyl)-tetraphosphatase (symmetrical)
MATYAIGDVQGCYGTFERLLGRIGFRPSRDRLWVAGDMVNRGPGSLEMLRWLAANSDSVTAVIGNHDLQLLAVADGATEPRRDDTLGAVLDAPDRRMLLHWLRSLPLVYRERPFIMVHAGFLPQWRAKDAERLARQCEAKLRGSERVAFLRSYFKRRVTTWGTDLTPDEQALVAIAVMTRIRGLDAAGQMVVGFGGPPELLPAGQLPWYDAPERRTAKHTVIFGHWAAHGLTVNDDIWALDSGAVWGRSLTAVRLEDRAVFSVPADPAAL